MDPAELAAALAGFRGSEHFYEHWSEAFEYTDGVKFLVDAVGANWLLDLIASWQKKARRTRDLRNSQLWILRRNPDNSAVLDCCVAADTVAFSVRIPFTDFPLQTLALYLEDGVLCLENER